MKAKRKTAPRSRFEIGLDELKTRLASADLPRTQRTVVTGAIARLFGEQHALWIDVPWSKLERKNLATDSGKTAVVVFAKPVVKKDALLLGHAELLGVESRRDTQIVVFLDTVRVPDMATVPGALTVFAKGLEVKRLASFESPDGHTEVAGHLKARFVVGNLFGGGVRVAPGTTVEVGDYAQKIDGLPKGSSATKHRTLPAMLPFLDEEEEASSDTWGLLYDLVASGTPFPKK